MGLKVPKAIMPGWPGSKRALFPVAFQYFAQPFHRWDYFETFAGPGNIIQCLPGKYHTETLVELEDALTTLLLAIKNDIDGFLRELYSVPFAVQGIYEQDAEQFGNSESREHISDVQVAVTFYRLCLNRWRGGWNGRSPGTFAGHFAELHREEGKMWRHTLPTEAEFREFSERLFDVVIFSGDCIPRLRDWLKLERAFIVEDPPYVKGKIYPGQVPLTMEWYQEYIEMHKKAKAFWIMFLSLANEELRQLIPDEWHLLSLEEAQYKMGTQHEGSTRKGSCEYLVSNRPFNERQTKLQANLH